MLFFSGASENVSNNNNNNFLLLSFYRNSSSPAPPPPPPIHKKEPHENLARIAKRYLDDNMQQAWINPRLISKVSFYIFSERKHSKLYPIVTKFKKLLETKIF